MKKGIIYAILWFVLPIPIIIFMCWIGYIFLYLEYISITKAWLNIPKILRLVGIFIGIITMFVVSPVLFFVYIEEEKKELSK